MNIAQQVKVKSRRAYEINVLNPYRFLYKILPQLILSFFKKVYTHQVHLIETLCLGNFYHFKFQYNFFGRIHMN